LRSILLIMLIFTCLGWGITDLAPTLWGATLIDDGGTLGLTMDYGTTERLAWGSAFAVGIFSDYYAFYPGVEGRFYFSNRSMGPVRLFLNGSLGPALGALNRPDGKTEFTLGGYGHFAVGGDFLSSDSVVPTVMLGGLVDVHSDQTITSILIGAGIRF
jgi:hypothetical protein